jgi:hypothetical protein
MTLSDKTFIGILMKAADWFKCCYRAPISSEPLHKRVITILFNYTNGSKQSILGMRNYTTLIGKAVDVRLILKIFNGEHCNTIVVVLRMGCQEFGSHDTHIGSRSKHTDTHVHTHSIFKES